jgi:hypothetical protein
MVLDINVNFAEFFKGLNCFKCGGCPKKIWSVNIENIREMEIDAINKIRLVANELTKDTGTIIYVNRYVNDVLENIVLIGTDVYAPQTFKNLLSIPIFFDKKLVGQIGLGEMSDESIPEELTNIIKFLGELLSKLSL